MIRFEPGAVPVGAGFAALSASAVLTEVARRVGLRHELVDLPTGRKSHAQPTPNLGGAAIVLSTLFAVCLYQPRRDGVVLIVVACAVAAALVGLTDDLRPLSPTLRLGIETVLATLVALAGVRMPVFGDPLDIAVTVVWIVVITNSCNLLDNMDGSAAAVGSVTAACLAATALAGSRDVAVPLFALSAACGGFLVHNWAPARIFMGDCGSLFLGFMISSLSVQVHSAESAAPAVTGTVLFALVPALDTLVVLISRHSAGRPLLAGGTDHVSHRMCRLGLSTQQAAVVLGVLAGVASLTGMCVDLRWLPVPLALAVVVPASTAVVRVMLKVPGYPIPPIQDAAVSTDVGNLGAAFVRAQRVHSDSLNTSDGERQDAKVGMAN